MSIVAECAVITAFSKFYVNFFASSQAFQSLKSIPHCPFPHYPFPITHSPFPIAHCPFPIPH
ncbi:hypothetical protein [Tolypothrix sp. VBCCA 56010]|uniref:hypothetical protein n=1 Tax=Tolypothrix sp. VBCCA 56010 TaxID=3137731 RepID=UPI003D7CA568